MDSQLQVDRIVDLLKQEIVPALDLWQVGHSCCVCWHPCRSLVEGCMLLLAALVCVLCLSQTWTLPLPPPDSSTSLMSML